MTDPRAPAPTDTGERALAWYRDHKREDGSYDGALYGDLNALAAASSDTPEACEDVAHARGYREGVRNERARAGEALREIAEASGRHLNTAWLVNRAKRALASVPAVPPPSEPT